MRRPFFLLLVFCLLLVDQDIQAQETVPSEFIIITKAPMRLKVAIPTFSVSQEESNLKPLARELEELLKEDLEISGIFQVVPKEQYLVNMPPKEDEEDFSGWSLIGVGAVIRGKIGSKGVNNYQLEFRLFEVSSAKMVLGKRYLGEMQSLRRMVHRFADEVLEWITGTRGGFESKIAFVSNHTGRKEIYYVDFLSPNPTQLTTNRLLNLSPEWLDSTRIYYTSYKRGNPDVYLHQIPSGAETLITNRPGLNIGVARGPGGKKIALAMESPGENMDIYVMNPDGSKPLRVTTHLSADLSPTWSSDGRFIAFVSDRTGSPQIYMIDLFRGTESKENSPIRLTFSGSYNVSPAWSPDGKYIAFTSRVGNQFDLFLLDFSSESRSLTRLTETAYNEEDPCWSPDSRLLAFSSNRDGSYDIYVISIYGGTPKKITNWKSNETAASWSPSLFGEGK